MLRTSQIKFQNKFARFLNEPLSIFRYYIALTLTPEESYAFIDWQDNNGRTALHLAIKESNIEVAKLLISRGCDLRLIYKLTLGGIGSGWVPGG